ncbi:MAG TPA: DNA mismatch repair protein MutS [Methylomusa anaerophila]|uniref:DNA mismatch repair protein MutS n=1 Tax=Methylomusa anaerophila TaxID=1930071 RepID=A0A348APV0_9FIRM|nr:DNA mismatch repair protein MutS [Methylomusa anaerophila]BBB93098.1 DNA mismatch repair protein MutS [Methylomusa anaerophila]HML87069.1 DNA mismatch repair protein MutS [Methylomusa anaerophila]
MTASYTPMMEQYRDIKSKHPNEILFFRLGDFYEMFFEDAELAARELEITLTSREGGHNIRVPMCGVPYHAVESYITKLINKGYKVAICEQVEDPKQTKGIVRREVIKIITPGTILSELLLSETGNNYLVLLYEEDDTISLSAADISTGECLWTLFAGNSRLTAVCDQLFRLMPSELVTVGKIHSLDTISSFVSQRIPSCAQTTLVVDDVTQAEQLPQRHFSPEELPGNPCVLSSLGYLLYYLHYTVKNDLSHINRLINLDTKEYLVLDAATLRNLEITRNMRDGGRKDTLLSVLDFTKTAMGGRLLKKWMEFPLINPLQIIRRQDAIEEFVQKPTLREQMIEELGKIYDFERIMTRIEVGTASARDLVSLKASLAVLPAIKERLNSCGAKFWLDINLSLNTHANVVNMIAAAIVDNPPLSVREGNIIRQGYDLELDELRSLARDSKQLIQEMEAKEREITGIKSLKVGYNKIFGYYIEVTHANSAAVPPNYVRKQTLVNAERYITPELKDFETKILGAQEKIVNIEYQLFLTIRDYIKERLQDIQLTARQIAQLDVITGLAEAAARYNYVRPQLNHNSEIIVKDGRHPVVERLLKREMFVPNDTTLNHNDSEIMIITGPNMAGKSTYMRQVALLTLMAQTGSFIPVREASICTVDRIFTRVGASDDLATGQSTFMVEMNEVAQIVKYASARSLIILDEIGRGTSTFDGMSIARAVVEYIRDKVGAKTLFATHYHELTDLADTSRVIKNYSIAVKERGSDIVFLRRIVPGGADKSYGIHVAQLAGLPKRIIERAQQVLQELEASKSIVSVSQQSREQIAATSTITPVSLFSSSVADEILTIDILSTTPLEALNILYRLQNKARKETGSI